MLDRNLRNAYLCRSVHPHLPFLYATFERRPSQIRVACQSYRFDTSYIWCNNLALNIEDYTHSALEPTSGNVNHIDKRSNKMNKNVKPSYINIGWQYELLLCHSSYLVNSPPPTPDRKNILEVHLKLQMSTKPDDSNNISPKPLNPTGCSTM